MRILILLTVLFSTQVHALACQRTGNCADKSLNQAYELKKELKAIKRQHKKDIDDIVHDMEFNESRRLHEQRQLNDIIRQNKRKPATNTWLNGVKH